MKIEEAKDQLKDLIKDRESFLDGQDDEIYRRDIEALEKAVEVLEKQIPKKVKNNGHNIFFCPVCRGSVWQIRDESKFCFRCGQAIDWSEEE